MIVSFPMYDRPETRDAYARLWGAIRTEFLAHRPDMADQLPKSPDHPDNPWTHWTSPDLLLSQTCGLPFRTRLKDRLTLVGTPDFRHAGCPPGFYCSVIVQPADTEPAPPEIWPDLTFAVNMFDSQSGWAAPQNFLSEQGLAVKKAIVTGSHRASALAVSERRADIAALDAQTWRMIERWDRFASSLTVTFRTPPTPALPFVTARADLADDLAVSTTAAIASLDEQDRALLDIQGLQHIPASAYLSVPTPPPL